VTVWTEFQHEKTDDNVRAVYPSGIHSVIAAFLNEQEGIEAATATMDQPKHGLTKAVLDRTDVLTWWGHMAHEDVDDAIVDRVHQRVLDGMGLICLHSAHMSKIFRKLMGTSCLLLWREADERERVWVLEPSHPIAKGLGPYFEVPEGEMYGERFDIPAPDELVFVSWYQGGDVFRSGCCFNRSMGKVFYFSPGHETFPIYYQPEIQKVIINGVRYVSPVAVTAPLLGRNVIPLEEIPGYAPPDYAEHT
jgi:trehalose utilization protein